MKQLYTLIFLSFFLWIPSQQTTVVAPAPEYDYGADSTVYETPQKERITLFKSDIQVAENADVTVTETIEVYATGDEIKRGLFRALPMIRNTKQGQIKIKYLLVSIKKDGVEEKYHTETKNKVFNIYIGNKDIILDPGLYTYEIVYKTQDQIVHFKGFDELYWNVNGTDWAFPIENIQAKITLPNGASILQNSCYTGVIGSTAQNCVSTKLGDTVMEFSADDLKEKENLTVAVGFKAGVLKEPSPFMKWLKRNWPSFFLLLPCFYLANFYFVNWKKYGKDPQKPTVIPQFKAPNNLSPASIGYLANGRFNISFATANLIDLAGKGYLTIDEVKAPAKKTGSLHYVIKRLTKKSEDLQPDEEILLSQIFLKSQEVEIFGKYNSKVKNAMYEVERVVEKNNKKWIKTEANEPVVRKAAKIILIALFSALIISAILTQNPAGIFFGILVVIDCIIIYFLVYLWKEKSRIAFYVTSFFALPFLIPLYFLAFPSGANISSFESDCFKFAILAIISLVIFQHLINKPSQEKVNMEAEIEGFKMYLGTAEVNQLQFFNPPEMTPEVYEKFLPYAIVFGVGGVWGKKFREKLRETLYAEDQYITDHRFTDDFARSLSTVLATTSTPIAYSSSSSSYSSSSSRSSRSPSYSGGSSSSGSSGGGSSGGGGGGGGGGGW